MGSKLASDTIRIGGGSGYWGDSDMAVPQLLEAGIDYIVFDYLAEITMSILARARAKSPEAGYATDFVTQIIAPNLSEIAAKSVKILANAGGVNPHACTREIEKLIRQGGLDLKVATVIGDDLTRAASSFSSSTEMFSGDPFPDPGSIASINAYLGAFPVAQALEKGADIVVTGRCVDSALALAACIHEFGWKPTDWDLLAAGSLAGHLVECGPQVTGGNTTDWEAVADSIDHIGYPIAEINQHGSLVVSKPDGTGGCVSRGCVAEQLLYEIGDPRAYTLPDVECDFSDVLIEEISKDRVMVRGAKGRPAPSTYKTSATYSDGFRIITLWYFIGRDSAAKAQRFADATLIRARKKLAALGLPDYTEVEVDPFGAGTHFDADSQQQKSREVALRIAARHENPKALVLLLKEASGMALATPPGMALYTGGRPSPSPVVRLFSFLVDKNRVAIKITMEDAEFDHQPYGSNAEARDLPPAPVPPVPVEEDDRVKVELRRLAWGRSGDKGNNANIAVIARKPEYMAHIWAQLTEDAVARRFKRFLKGPVERFYLPGPCAVNYLMHDVLGGGGVASLRADPQGKSYAEILLDTRIEVPEQLLDEGSLGKH